MKSRHAPITTRAKPVAGMEPRSVTVLVGVGVLDAVPVAVAVVVTVPVEVVDGDEVVVPEGDAVPVELGDAPLDCVEDPEGVMDAVWLMETVTEAVLDAVAETEGVMDGVELGVRVAATEASRGSEERTNERK